MRRRLQPNISASDSSPMPCAKARAMKAVLRLRRRSASGRSSAVVVSKSPIPNPDLQIPSFRAGGSPMPASWSQIVPWLRQIDGLIEILRACAIRFQECVKLSLDRLGKARQIYDFEHLRQVIPYKQRTSVRRHAEFARERAGWNHPRHGVRAGLDLVRLDDAERLRRVRIGGYAIRIRHHDVLTVR